MNCEELLAALNEYVDGDAKPGICEAFEEHLKDCNPCQIVVDNIRQTITLYKHGEAIEIPVKFHNQLCRCLRDRWKDKFGSAK
jgi:predicted anti-sigma-YlaC factor YlaD